MAFDGRILSGVSVLAAVVDGGSFVKAAELIGLTDSGVSRAISRLEARLGVRLLDRTTRSVTLTDEGRRFYEEAKPHLAAIEDAAVVVSDGIDLAIRFGQPRFSTLVARKLIEAPILTVASPQYIARYGRPKHPSD